MPRTLLLLFFSVLTLFSCSKNDTVADPCTGVSYAIQYFKTESIGSSNNGTINISFPVGDTISYSLNGTSFQASPLLITWHLVIMWSR